MSEDLLEAVLPAMRVRGLTPVKRHEMDYGFVIGIMARHDDGREVAFAAHKDEATPGMYAAALDRWDGRSHAIVDVGTKYRELMDRLASGELEWETKD